MFSPGPKLEVFIVVALNIVLSAGSLKWALSFLWFSHELFSNVMEQFKLWTNQKT